MKSTYNVEVFSLPTGEECNYWADVWNTDTLTLSGDCYEKKKEQYTLIFQNNS